MRPSRLENLLLGAVRENNMIFMLVLEWSSRKGSLKKSRKPLAIQRGLNCGKVDAYNHLLDIITDFHKAPNAAVFLQFIPLCIVYGLRDHNGESLMWATTYMIHRNY